MNNISALAFDLDGTLYNGKSAIKGALDTITILEDLNYKIFYFTNNSAKTRQQIVDKLNGLGFPAKLQNTYCTSHAIKTYLLEKKLKSIYLIGSKDLEGELSACSIKIKESPHVPAVVVGLDASFDYNKIATALEAINNGAKLIVANSDPSYPIENNRRLPGCGAMVGAIVSATDHIPDFIVGKPNTYMLKLLCKDHKLLPVEICIVGDSPDSDIKMASNLKCQSILFDPKNAFSCFSGNKVKRLREIILLINKKKRLGK
ncbi:MAG: HAD-IIA family hydrolase [Candidatus Omnitrophota bacterium]|nr:HAD-IIA family hydrolase [Candidatus Omnitrophota bacterium]